MPGFWGSVPAAVCFPRKDQGHAGAPPPPPPRPMSLDAPRPVQRPFKHLPLSRRQDSAALDPSEVVHPELTFLVQRRDDVGGLAPTAPDSCGVLKFWRGH